MTALRRPAWLLPLILSGIALVGGLAFRFHHVLTEPLWLDEAYTAYAADRGLAFLWQVVPGYETHPPFYYTLMHLWGLLAGDALATRRVPGLVAAVLLLVVAAIAGGRVAPDRRSDAWTGGVALGLLALSPMAIEMARQMRPYPFMGLTGGVALLALLAIGRRRRQGRAIGRMLPAAVLACEPLMAWLHNVGPLHAFAIGVALLVQCDPRDRRGWTMWVMGQGLVVLAWLPAMLILADQAPTWMGSTWLEFRWSNFPDSLGLLYATPAMLPLMLALAAFGAMLLAKEDGRPRDAVALALLAFLPVILSVALSVALAPVFLTRTLSPVLLPAILLVARGSLAPGRARWLGAALVLVLAWSFVRQDIAWRQRGPMQQWHLAVEWLAKRHRPGDAIWAYPNEGGIPFDYAARDLGLPLRARAIPMPVPARGIGYYPTGSRGAVSLRPAEIARFMADPQAKGAPTLWLLRLGANAYDADDAMLNALEAGGRTVVSGFRAGPISFIGLRRHDLPPPDYLAGRGRSGRGSISDPAGPAGAGAGR